MDDRNQSFDALKGILILFVIMGHILLGEINQNQGREIIYFFHMPIFLAVTGYFTKELLVKSTAKDIFKKYKYRMLIPFLLAYIFYTSLFLLQGYLTGKLQSLDIIMACIYPYYHLWYIPAVFLFVFYTKLLEAMPRYLYFIALLLFASFAILYEGWGQLSINENIVLKLFGDKRFYAYFFFYYLGYFISTRKVKINEEVSFAIFIVGLLIYGYSNNQLLIGFGKTISNIIIIIILLNFFQKSSYTSLFMAKIGKVSLPIYLWHVFPLIVLKKLSLSEAEYYLLSVILITSFIYAVIKLQGGSAVTDKYVYGIRR
jgi:fucose 4-O-acetylase-like acetyltransferase